MQNVEIGVVLREWLWVTQGHQQIQQSAHDFLFNFNRNYTSILYCFQVIASYLLKVAHLHLAAPFGLTAFKFCGDLWHKKTSVSGLSCGIA